MFKKRIAYLVLSLLFLNLIAAPTVFAQSVPCEGDNAALQDMYSSTVSFEQGSAETKKTINVSVKIADTNATRAAGFQRVCASTIAATPILFLFDKPAVPSFHMNNVVAPIDIAFIDKNGAIESIQVMQPYSLLLKKKPLYSPKRPVIAALEARPGFYSDKGLKVGDILRWASASSNDG